MRWNQLATGTGRVSARTPNVQQLPKTETRVPLTDGSLLVVSMRSAFRPRAGLVLFSSDYKQLEMRILAALSRDDVLQEQLQSRGTDFFRSLATKFYRKPLAEVTPQDRDRIKQLCYGIIYGLGNERLAENLGVRWEQANDLRQQFFTCFKQLDQYMSATKRQARKDGFVTTLGGRKRLLPGLRSPNQTERSKAERQVVNSVVQGSAADVAKEAMLRCWAGLSEKHIPCNLICQVHDELVFECSEDTLAAAAQTVGACMQTLGALGGSGNTVPFLPVAISAGPSWGEMLAFDHSM
jgi:DNA polymerase I-like protein with 3'-5' exonuclease and polymerase domains